MGEGCFVFFAGLTVDEAEAEGFFEGLLIGQSCGGCGAFLGQGEPDAWRAGVMFEKPFAPEGSIGYCEDGKFEGHFETLATRLLRILVLEEWDWSTAESYEVEVRDWTDITRSRLDF